MYRIAAILVLLGPLCQCQSFVDDAIYTVNSLKALHSVSEKFISISIDPAVLLAGLNLSDTSLELAKHLNPSFIRIAGPSTQFVKYEPDLDETAGEDDATNVIVTPSMWFGINEWLTLANLTPVFGINDVETTNGRWQPKSTIALFELSDKLNISCYWQLGYDCSNKTTDQYKNDLKTLHNVLTDYPDKKSQWKIVGSDLSQCVSNNHPEIGRKIVDDLYGSIDAVMWEPSDINQKHLLQDFVRPKVPVWTTAPKESHSVSFASALSWAKQLGEVGKSGFDVLFRQPRLHEFFSETPAYWVSVLHKMLMGRNVLDVKSSGIGSDLGVYGHCSKHQNNFARSGAATILIVNNGTTNRTATMKFGVSTLMKTTEVQAYILTAPNGDEDSTDVYLNDEKLSLDKFEGGNKLNISPKLRYARIMNYLSLTLPPKSVGFFVLPGIQLPVCQNKESNLDELIEEIHEDQKISFKADENTPENPSTDLDSRLGMKKPQTLKEIQQMMEKELESDEKYYKKMKVKRNFPKKRIEEQVENNNPRDVRNFFIERAKLAEKQRKQVDRPSPTQLFEMRHPPTTTTAKSNTRELELELTSGEIKRILADRAKAKAAKKNILFTSEELEEIMNKATEKILKNKNTSITIRRKTKRAAEADINMAMLKKKTLGSSWNKKQLLARNVKNNKPRNRRDINLDMLKLKTEMMQNKNKKHVAKFENNENKMATIRQDGDLSSELFPESEEKPIKTTIPNKDVFAQIASGEEITTTEKSPLKRVVFKPTKINHQFNIPKIDLTLPKPIKPAKQHLIPKTTQPEDDLSELENEEEVSIDDDFGCIHEFMPETHEPGQKTKIKELWEVQESVKEPSNHLPELANRGFLLSEESGEAGGPLRNLERFLKKHSLEDESISGDYGDIDSSTGPLRRKRSQDQREFLRKRLAFRKQIEMINKTPSLAHNNNNEQLEKMRIKYKPLSDSLKEWKPSDLLTFSRSRKTRNVDNKINSIENEIDSFMNEIAKDPQIIKPKLDVENGDYQLIFPNSDKIEVIEKDNGTELKLQLHEVNNTKTNNNNNGTDKNSNIQKIPRKQVDHVWKQIFSKLSNFFRGLGNKLKDYVFEDLLK